MLNLDRQSALELSRDLREGRDAGFRRRRGVVGLSLVAALSMGVISLYQTGIIRHIPEPKLPLLDADRVDGSPDAYRRFATPDALLGLGSYAATAGLAAMGNRGRSREHPWVPLALAGKAGFDLFQALLLTRDQWVKHRAFCSWCLLATATTVVTARLVVPEALDAIRSMRSQSGIQDPSRNQAPAVIDASTRTSAARSYGYT